MPWGRILYSPVERVARVALYLAISLALPIGALSQAPTHGTDPTYSSPNSGTVSREAMSDTTGRVDPVEAARRQHARRAEIRQSVDSDIAKMIKLAQELDDEVSRTSPATLNVAQLKKVAEIEKLAHKVKAKMIEYDGGTPPPPPPIVPLSGPQHQ